MSLLVTLKPSSQKQQEKALGPEVPHSVEVHSVLLTRDCFHIFLFSSSHTVISFMEVRIQMVGEYVSSDNQ